MLITKHIWDDRLADITHFEDYLRRQGTIILKFFLNVSRKEQKKRFMERLDEPNKYWKFSASDVHERKFWSDYMYAFEEAVRATASKHARAPRHSGLHRFYGLTWVNAPRRALQIAAAMDDLIGWALLFGTIVSGYGLGFLYSYWRFRSEK